MRYVIKTCFKINKKEEKFNLNTGKKYGVLIK